MGTCSRALSIATRRVGLGWTLVDAALARLREGLTQLPGERGPDVSVDVRLDPTRGDPDGVLHRPGRGGPVADDARAVDAEQRRASRLRVVDPLPQPAEG